MFYQHLKNLLLLWSKGAGIAVSVQRQGYWLDDPWSDSYQGQQIFHISRISRSVQVPIRPSIHRVPGALVLGVKGPGNEVDCSCPSVTQVKNEWNCTSAPPVCLYCMHKDKVTCMEQCSYRLYWGLWYLCLSQQYCWRFTSSGMLCHGNYSIGICHQLHNCYNGHYTTPVLEFFSVKI